jgi:anti-sigma regulatory factor (Ser/Thr protein kinase)
MEPLSVTVADPSHVSAARQGAQRLAHRLDFDETRKGRVAIAVTEAVTNMLKHAGGGTLVARSLASGDAVGIEVLAIDAGPGMQSFRESARDGVSTTGTAGTGLGAMQRQSDEFEVYTLESRGTIVRMVFWSGKAPQGRENYAVGAISVPKAGETACGDAWGMEEHALGATFLVADGLGHGPDACRAATRAVETLHTNAGRPAAGILDLAHANLKATRGAALAVMRHDSAAGEIAFAGVGNVAACVLEGASRRTMISHNGIVGHNMHKSEEYRYPWPPGALLIAHTDGLETQWSLSAFPGLTGHHPSMIAAMLFREHSRKRDDVTVVVARAMPH